MQHPSSFLPALAMVCLATTLPKDSLGATKVNLARETVSVSASYSSITHPVSLINDGSSGATSYWSGYQGRDHYGQYDYVELNWDRYNEILQSTIYWATAGDSIANPTDAYLAYWDGHNWVKAHMLDAADKQNRSITNDTLTTNRLRIYMRSEVACGIREVRLVGYLGEVCKAALLEGETLIPYRDEPIVLSPQLTLPEGEAEEPIWNWTLPNGTTATTPSVLAEGPGEYTVCYQRSCGNVTSMTYVVYDPSETYHWPTYSPTLFYDYRNEYPKLDPPTKFLPENNNQKGIKADGWWAIAWGPKASHYVTETAKEGLLKKMNEDFAFFRDVMGWPPDKRARNGYYSTVYVYGSGLYSDGEDSTALGGWQSATNYNGNSWPMVYLSYYPIACFDPKFTYDSYQRKSVGDQTFQQNACVHEGIHAIFADLEGCKNSAWYQEAGNTWLQGEAELVKTGKDPESMGWLSAGNMIAPFLPIECYSGWLLDDSFGGPSAEGVNMYGSSGQICTWRRLLGGVQYGELFPHFVSEILGRGSIPWIWRYCKNRVLDGMADSLGDRQMRHLIMEYRSRQAMIDVGQWSKACKKLINDNWLASIEQEWSPYWKKVEPWKVTPYANMYPCDEVDSVGWWKPEWRTTPGWSGANQVPLHVNGKVGNMISIHFKPLGQNMLCQLCYRAMNGHVYYSRPVEGEGDVVMKLQEAPANGVVIAVICNTDYIYKGEATRKAHYNYHLKMGENVYRPAKAQLKWYEYTQTIRDTEFITGIEAPIEEGSKFTITPEKTIVRAGESIPLHIGAATQLQVTVQLLNTSGQRVYSQSFMRDGDYHLPAGLQPGIYILYAEDGGQRSSVKLVVK